MTILETALAVGAALACVLTVAKARRGRFSAQDIAMRESELKYFNARIREAHEHDSPADAWEDATDLRYGPYPGSLMAARHKLAPWRY